MTTALAEAINRDTYPLLAQMVRAGGRIGRKAVKVLAACAREDLLAFAYLAETDSPFHANWHHRLICDEIMQTLATPGENLLISTPPGHGKSRLAGAVTPVWASLRSQGSEMIASASHTAALAETNSKNARRVAKAAAAVAALGPFGVGASRANRGEDVSDTRLEWDVTWNGKRRGYYLGVGVGGAITGRRWTLGIIDDPIRGAQDADSLLIRDRQWDWYQFDWRSRRLGSRARQIMILTRWHEDDMAGRAIAEEGLVEDGGRWRVVTLPAQADEYTADVLHPEDPREPGSNDWLWAGPPYDYDVELAKIRGGEDAVPSRVWEALYQQRPTAAGGNLWLTEYFRAARYTPSGDGDYGAVVIDGVPTSVQTLFRYATVDLALGYRDGDWTSIMVWGLDRAQKRVFLLDVVRKKLSIPDTRRELDRLQDVWGLSNVYVETVQAQQGVVQEWRTHARLNLCELTTGKDDKAARLRAVEHWGSQGRVWHMEGASWDANVRRELLAFRGHRDDVDDMVDTYAYGLRVAINMVRGNLTAAQAGYASAAAAERSRVRRVPGQL